MAAILEPWRPSWPPFFDVIGAKVTPILLIQLPSPFLYNKLKFYNTKFTIQTTHRSKIIKRVNIWTAALTVVLSEKRGNKSFKTVLRFPCNRTQRSYRTLIMDTPSVLFQMQVLYSCIYLVPYDNSWCLSAYDNSWCLSACKIAQHVYKVGQYA